MANRKAVIKKKLTDLNRSEKQLGEVLVKEKLISLHQLEETYKFQRQTGGRFTSMLLELGYLDERDLIRVLGDQYDFPVIDLNGFECEKEALKTLPKQVCKKHSVLPISKVDNTLVVAFADPTNIDFKNDLALLTRCKIEVVIASEIAINKAIDIYYKDSDQFQALVSAIETENSEKEESKDSLSKAESYLISEGVAHDGPIIKFVNVLLAEAIQMKASDIHIEPYEKKIKNSYSYRWSSYGKNSSTSRSCKCYYYSS